MADMADNVLANAALPTLCGQKVDSERRLAVSEHAGHLRLVCVL